VTVHAASTVLAAFMAGLALGSVAAGRVADRARRPLVWFGAVEALIAITALASPGVLRLVERAFVTLAQALPDSLPVLTAARFVCAFAVLVVPTVLMGSTLPLVIKSSLVSGSALGRNVGLLYGANTAGAVAGALVAGVHLVGPLGIRASFLVAAGINLLVAAAAVAIGARLVAPASVFELPPPAAPDSGQAAPGPRRAPTPAAARAVLLVFGVSGFASLALEVIWFRILVVHLGGTIYAFISMLSTFLAGIAIGSWAVVPLMRRERSWLSVLAAFQAATGIVTILSLTIIAAIVQQPWLRTSHITTLAIAPATLLMGLAFPLGMRLWVEGDARAVAGRIGVFYAVNVCGAVAGSIAAGFLLLPRLGARVSLIVVAAMYVASALLLLAHLRAARPAMRWAGAAIVVAAFGWLAVGLPDPFEVALGRLPGPILWRQEGVQTTVSVHHRVGGGAVMFLDGLHQANDSAEMVTVHRMIGALPLALHPQPVDALVIGLGGGATAGAVTRHAGVMVDVVELSDAVVQGAKWFRNVNYDVLNAPNVHLRVDDGRNFLLLNRRKYDVITADIIQPGHAGAGGVYSVEYFRLARAALKDGGIMLQWIGHRETTPYKLIMRTFLDVFPDATLWADGTLMAASTGPLRIQPTAFELKLEDPATRELLTSVGLDSFDALQRLYVAGPDEMRAFVGDGAVLTDDRPLVEYFKTLPAGEGQVDLAGLRGDVRRHIDADP
jgi:spermidine synthase